MSRLITVTLVVLLGLGASSVHAADELPIFDTHLHYSSDSWTVYSPDEILGILDQAGVYRALVSSTPDDGTLMLQERDPGRILPVLRPYRARSDMGTWMFDTGVLEYAQERLKQRPYLGIGEFHMDAPHVASPVVQAFARVGAEQGLFLHAHTDASGVAALAPAYPEARILWAHAGMNADTATISRLLANNPNLWVELALRYDVAPGGRLDPRWVTLFQQYPDRFMVGTDTWIPPQWTRLPQLMATVRGWLSQLPRDLAERIAYANAEALFPMSPGARVRLHRALAEAT